MEHIVFVTGNKSKAQQVQTFLDVPVERVTFDLEEIQSLDLQEIVEHKARGAYNELQKPVLIEDTSLVFHEMKRLPGPFIKWFVEEVGNERLCAMVGDDRSAHAIAMYAIYDGSHMRVFEGGTKGSIATRPQGEHGFGWDPIFIPQGETRTWAQMTLEERKATSMRRKALEKVRAYLKGE